MEKETIADLCKKLRKSGELDCLSIANEWGPNCVNVSDCDACQKAVYDSIADRIEAAHQREMHELTNVINLSNRIFRNGVVIRSTDRRREVVKRLKEYREHPPVRDVGGLIVEDTYSVGEVEGIVTGKETFTTGEYIDALISLIDTSNQSDGQSDAPESGENSESAATKDEMCDHEDTRKKVESSLARLIVGICAARLRTDKTNMELVARFKDEFIKILDRQEAITERNCRAEYDDMRDYLQAQVDGLHEEIDKLKKDRDGSIIKSTVAFSAINGEGGWRDIVSGLEAKVDALESENDRLKEKVSNQRKELDIHQTMYDVEAVAQLKRERKMYKGMYNSEHQIACSQRRKLDRLTEENEAMRQALRDLGDILE